MPTWTRYFWGWFFVGRGDSKEKPPVTTRPPPERLRGKNGVVVTGTDGSVTAQSASKGRAAFWGQRKSASQEGVRWGRRIVGIFVCWVAVTRGSAPRSIHERVLVASGGAESNRRDGVCSLHNETGGCSFYKRAAGDGDNGKNLDYSQHAQSLKRYLGLKHVAEQPVCYLMMMTLLLFPSDRRPGPQSAF